MFAILNTPVVVDDTGFFLDDWKRLPGPFLKYFEDGHPRTALIRLLGDAENRRGYAKCCIAYCDGTEEFVASGELHGVVAHESRGQEGMFGFDYVLIPDGYDKTLAELGPAMKNQISHRANALKEFKKLMNISHPQT